MTNYTGNNPVDVAVRAARSAGSLIMDQYTPDPRKSFQTKDQNDYVTEVDLAAEKIITGEIFNAFPGHQILAEESGRSGQQSEYLWIIDPLDGTTNFIHGIPHFAVSISFLHRGIPRLGVIYNPVLDECFTGIRDRGSYLNDRKISVSRTAQLKDALGATGFPFRTHDMLCDYLTIFNRLFQRVRGMRRCGSAALDLAYVACGRYDFFWESFLQPWDFMGGALMVQEAGGRISRFDGSEMTMESGSVLAANKDIYPLILEELSRPECKIP